jgi:hypothetical protein
LSTTYTEMLTNASWEGFASLLRWKISYPTTMVGCLEKRGGMSEIAHGTPPVLETICTTNLLQMERSPFPLLIVSKRITYEGTGYFWMHICLRGVYMGAFFFGPPRMKRKKCTLLAPFAISITYSTA